MVSDDVAGAGQRAGGLEGNANNSTQLAPKGAIIRASLS